MGGLRWLLSPEVWGPTARQIGPGARSPAAPQPLRKQPCPSQMPASVPSRCLALGGQLCGAGHAQPEAQKPDVTRAVVGASGFEQNTYSAPGWEGPTWPGSSDDR